jgi:hypothetical protein
MQAALPILAFLLFMILMAAAVVLVVAYFTKPPILHTRRLYLDPSMDLGQRERLLSTSKAESESYRFYNYYVVMPGEEIPIFDPSPKDLAEAEFLIIEYLEPETARTQAS